MKLSEKIRELDAFNELLEQRQSAARTLADIDAHEAVDLYGEYDKVSVKKGHPLFEKARGIVADMLADAEARLVAAGYELDGDPDGDAPEDDGE